MKTLINLLALIVLAFSTDLLSQTYMDLTQTDAEVQTAITNALTIDDSLILIKDNIKTSVSNPLKLRNTTNADAVNVYQYSPGLVFQDASWDVGTGTSLTNYMRIRSTSSSEATMHHYLQFDQSYDGASWTNIAQFYRSESGTLGLTCASIFASTQLQTPLIFPGSEVDLKIATRTAATDKAIIFGSTAGSVEWMRIMNGMVGIGNTDPTAYSDNADDLVVGSLTGHHGITILSDGSSTGGIRFGRGTTSSLPYRGIIEYNQSTEAFQFTIGGVYNTEWDNSYLKINQSGADYDYQFLTDNEDSAFVIDGANGNIYMEGLGSGTGTPLSRVTGTDQIVLETSSEKYKKNISNWDINPETIYKLNARQFDWNDKSAIDGKHDVGLVAEEVAKVLPEVALFNEQGNINSWSPQKMITYLIEVVKEQGLEIKDLQNRVTLLEE